MPASRQKSDAPSVTVELSYITDGISNEHRMGFYTQDQSSSAEKNFFYDFADPKGDKDERSIYVCTKKEGRGDIRTQSNELPNIDGDLSLHDYIHEDSKDLNTIVFQNCYAKSHSVNVEIGAFAQSSVNFISESVVMYASGSGISVPYLNTKDGTVAANADETKFIIPKHFSEDNIGMSNLPSTFAQGDITVDILNATQPTNDHSIQFHNEIIQSYSASTNLGRENIHYVGNKIPSDRPLVFPVITECSVGLLATGNLSGNLIDNLSINSDYNLVVKFRKDTDVVMRHVLSGAKLMNISQGMQIGGEKGTKLNFSCPNDFENNDAGLFVSGSVQTFTYQVIDSNGNFIVNNSSQNIGNDFFPPF
jgi:hypothetical protein